MHYGHNMSGGETQKRPIRFGPSHVDYVPITAINELPQVRVAYNREALDELATAIVNNPDIDADTPETEDFDLLHPLNLGRHDAASAKRYIKDHGDYYGIPSAKRSDAGSLVAMEDGSKIISIAGHRRKRAIAVLMGRYDIDPLDVQVAADVRWNIGFAEAQGMQLRENVYDRPPAQDEARAIALFYQDIVAREHKQPHIGKFAAQLGFSETKVRDALAFSSLPDSVQAYTTNGLLPYSVVRRLKPLADAYRRFYAHITDPEKIERNIEHELVAFCNQMVQMDLSGNAEQRRARMIDNKTKEIFGQADYQQEGLFLLESATPERRRQTSSVQLSTLAFTVIRHQIKQNELSLPALEELEKALQQAKDIAVSRNTLLDIFDESAS